jgi:peptidoglycan hydrolase-like protein with peptidoglycan-binding domain
MVDPFVSALSKAQADGVVEKLLALGVSAEAVEGPPGLFSVRKTPPPVPGGGAGAAPSGADPNTALRVGEQQLHNLFKKCAFVFPEKEMFFFGIRGVLPTDIDDGSFSSSKTLVPAKIDYNSMACTIGQWSPTHGVAVFPGSTVPNMQNIAAAAGRQGEGANVLCRCKVAYVKGIHKQGTPTGHKAFIQDGYFPGTRSKDKIIGDEDDFFDTSGNIFFDDLHAAWSAGPAKGTYSSAGCQVVAGFPSCPRRDNGPDVGPWAIFRANAYGLSQSRFVYVLFNVFELRQANQPDGSASSLSLRFGSEGDAVAAVQDKLKEAGFDPGPSGGLFNRRTLQAVLAFQLKSMGPAGIDGIVGSQTMTALGLESKAIAHFGPEESFDGSTEGEVRQDNRGMLSDQDPIPDGPVVIKLSQSGNRWGGAVGDEPFPIGTATRFSSGGKTRIGLFQSSKGLDGLVGGKYSPVAYRAKLKGLADLLGPTAAAESGLMFNRLNTYDRCCFYLRFHAARRAHPTRQLCAVAAGAPGERRGKELFSRFGAGRWVDPRSLRAKSGRARPRKRRIDVVDALPQAGRRSRDAGGSARGRQVDALDGNKP